MFFYINPNYGSCLLSFSASIKKITIVPLFGQFIIKYFKGNLQMSTFFAKIKVTITISGLFTLFFQLHTNEWKKCTIIAITLFTQNLLLIAICCCKILHWLLCKFHLSHSLIVSRPTKFGSKIYDLAKLVHLKWLPHLFKVQHKNSKQTVSLKHWWWNSWLTFIYK